MGFRFFTVQMEIGSIERVLLETIFVFHVIRSMGVCRLLVSFDTLRLGKI
jgi:hypothetical protein